MKQRKINNNREDLNDIINKNNLISIENCAFHRIQLFSCIHVIKINHVLNHKENLPKVEISQAIFLVPTLTKWEISNKKMIPKLTLLELRNTPLINLLSKAYQNLFATYLKMHPKTKQDWWMDRGMRSWVHMWSNK